MEVTFKRVSLVYLEHNKEFRWKSEYIGANNKLILYTANHPPASFTASNMPQLKQP